MYFSSINMANRVAHRYRQAQTREDPHDHPIIWTIPPTFSGISDDVVVQCSDGCTVTTEDVESAISKTRGITRGSCKFSEVHAVERSNRVRFQVRDKDARRIRGSVTVNVVANEDQVTAFSLILLDDEVGSR